MKKLQFLKVVISLLLISSMFLMLFSCNGDISDESEGTTVSDESEETTGKVTYDYK